MKYQSGAAFRRALEQRLLTRSRDRRISLVRLRKAVVFDRLPCDRRAKPLGS
jgi:hypothetical protein